VLLGWGKGCSRLAQQNSRGDKMNILSLSGGGGREEGIDFLS